MMTTSSIPTGEALVNPELRKYDVYEGPFDWRRTIRIIAAGLAHGLPLFALIAIDSLSKLQMGYIVLAAAMCSSVTTGLSGSPRREPRTDGIGSTGVSDGGE